MVTQELIDWYERKTAFLIEKYGPGPRVHYHTGLVDPREATAREPMALRRQLFLSQERMLDVAAKAWDAAANLRGDLVDVGCGLGGSCLYFAERFGARVTGITPIPGHVGWVNRFAHEAGLDQRVRAELGDAHAIPGHDRFDAAYAFGAVNYFDRPLWFERLLELLRPGAHVCIEDTLFIDRAMAVPFNEYWLSNMGTRDDYISAARASGFELVRLDDVTGEATGFWRLSLAYSRMLLETSALTDEEIRERQRSIEWQTRFHDAYANGGVENLLLMFRKQG